MKHKKPKAEVDASTWAFFARVSLNRTTVPLASGKEVRRAAVLTR
jgi:hypothetical protein